jgi:hypothetical protein
MGMNSENAQHITGGAAALPLFFDIETAAISDASSYDFDPIEAPANYVDPVKIEKYLTAERTKRLDRAALDPDLCRVVCLVYAVGDGPLVTHTAADEDEEHALLEAWVAVASEHRPLIGFNALGFDAPVLVRRCQYLGVEPPRLDLSKYRSADVIDLMQVLSFNGAIKAHSQAFYCKRFGLSTGDTIKGSEIPALVAAGEWQRVEDHCRADVDGLRQLAAKLGVWPKRQTGEAF